MTSSDEVSSTHLERVRAICATLPETTERPSHGEPTFFVHKRVYVMFANDHHGDGRIAVWLPVPLGAQDALIAADPDVYFRPPYVGVRGWVGIALGHIDDEALRDHIEMAWTMVAPRRLTRAEGDAP